LLSGIQINKYVSPEKTKAIIEEKIKVPP